MEVSGEYLFEAPRDVVWKALQDPKVLGSVMPGGQSFEQVAENQFVGVIQVKVGPVQGTFQGKIQLSNVKEPESYTMDVDGKGAPGFVKATGNIKLEARDSQTHMDYSGQAQIGGKIASVGQRLLDTTARSIIKQGLDGLNEYLKIQVAQLAAQQQPPAASSTPTTAGNAPSQMAAAAAVPVYKPPSEMQLALNVARDVIGDYIPPKYQPVAIGGIVVVILVLIKVLFFR